MRRVKASTIGGYEVVAKHIRGSILVGTPEERAAYVASGQVPKGARLLPMLGRAKLTDLTTAAIRAWHGEVAEHAGVYTANRAASHLRSILALAEEDFGVRAPAMPNNLARRRNREKKAILTSEHIATVIVAAKSDPQHGLYYAFPFLAGTRPSEQLGLLWDEVDFERGVIRIYRMQERDGSLTEMTKTEAGTREIPMGATLRAMLLDWRVRCPRQQGVLYRVFPGPGSASAMAEAAARRRRAAALPKFPPALLATGIHQARAALRDAAQRAPLVHFDVAGAGGRSRSRRQARRSRQRGGDAGTLHPGGEGRRGGLGRARAGISGGELTAPMATVTAKMAMQQLWRYKSK
ncbi:MAG: hypothetical protein WA459_22295 [Stellaceae bacterium]